MLQRLQDYHGWMLALLDEVEPLLRDPEQRPSVPYLAVRRTAMGQMLLSYQRFLQAEIFDPLILRGSATDSARARGVKIDCIALAEAYRVFLRRWIVEDVADDWEAYSAIALEMTVRVRQTIGSVAELALYVPPDPVPSGSDEGNGTDRP